MFEFQWPWMFILLLLPLWFRQWAKPVKNKANPKNSQALIIPFLDELDSSPETTRKPESGFILMLLLLATWGLLIVAVAKPIWINGITNLPVSSRNIIVAIDLSGSMAQRDFTLHGSRITRLAATKKVARNFIDHRVGDKVGLILFADHAYLQAPLTRDRQTVMKLLDEAELGLAGERTALGNAIGLAVKKVQEQPHKEHVLVLMTDGAATVGVNVDEAIRFANKVNLKIYTLGIGSVISSASIQLSRNNRANKGSSLDEITLKKIAAKTGGHYFRAKSVRELEAIYAELDKLEPVVDTSKAQHPEKDLFYLPLALACLLLITLGLLQGRDSHA